MTCQELGEEVERPQMLFPQKEKMKFTVETKRKAKLKNKSWFYNKKPKTSFSDLRNNKRFQSVGDVDGN